MKYWRRLAALQVSPLAALAAAIALGARRRSYGRARGHRAGSPSCVARAGTLPVAQGGLATATVGGRILAIGGFSGNFKAVLHTVQAYNPSTNHWQALAPMPTARGQLRVTVSRGLMYAIGGAGGNGKPVAAVEVYHPAANRWTKARPLSVPREGAGVATTADGRIVVIGGCCTAAHRIYPTAAIYQPQANGGSRFPGCPCRAPGWSRRAGHAG